MSNEGSKNNKLVISESQLTEEQIKKVNQLRQDRGLSFLEAIQALGYRDPEIHAKKLAEQYSVPYLDLSQFKPDPSVLKLVSPKFCRTHKLIPVSRVGEKSIVVAFANPNDLALRGDLSSVTQKTIQAVVSSEVKIIEAIAQFYKPKRVSNKFEKQLKREQTRTNTKIEVEGLNIDDVGESDAVVIKFVNSILAEAIQTKASDIHIEVYEKTARVRLRIDGKLQERLHPPKSAASSIASRIKIMSKLDIAEKRRPQDGRLKVRRSSGKEVDFRVSVIPVLFGEKIVMRLLDQSNLIADLNDLYLSEGELTLIKDSITKPQGMVLMTGPTGSGKTTTIYSILDEINTKEINISTAEDPVEYNLMGINQVQVNSEIGFQFADALRSFLRQDPDVIMVGEIRDRETAEISFKAASTGHLVVSTLHTNDSVSTVTRLVDIGVAPYMVSEVLTLVIAQRLVRKNCSSCSQPHHVEEAALLELGVKKEELHLYNNLQKGVGCSKCNNSGYRGRMPIFEILQMTTALRRAIILEKTNAELKSIARKSGLITLRSSALSRLKEGYTTIEEVVNSSISDEGLDEH